MKVRPGFTLLVGTLILWGCGDDLTAPRTGSIEVTSTTTGDLPDADGYMLTIDGGTPLALGSNSRVTLSQVMAGDHQLELTGLAANCVTNGPNPRPLVLPGGSNTQVTFEVECHTPSGRIHLLATTRGEDPDADGYAVTLDGGSPQAIGSSGSLDLTGIMPGEHRVHLDGIAPN